MLFTLMWNWCWVAGNRLIFITHFLDQVYEVCDRITVLRNGELVGTRDTSQSCRASMKRYVGRELDDGHALRRVPWEDGAQRAPHSQRQRGKKPEFGKRIVILFNKPENAKVIELYKELAREVPASGCTENKRVQY